MTSGPFGLESPGGFTADDFFRLVRGGGLPQSFGLGGPQAPSPAAPQPQPISQLRRGLSFGPVGGTPAPLTNLPPGAEGPPAQGMPRQPMGRGPMPAPEGLSAAGAPSPLSFGPLRSASPEDVAQLGRPNGADAGGGLDGSGSAVDVPLPPPRPPALSFGPLSAPSPQQEPATTGSVPSDAAGISNPPLPPPRPFGFGRPEPAPAENTAPGARPPQGGDPRADMPVSGAVPLSGSMAPNAATPPAAEKAEPSMMDRFVSGLKQSDDLLLGIGTGLMSTHGFGNGVAAGLRNYEAMAKNRTATDLARAELGLKVRKAQRESTAENATIRSIAQKLNVSYDEASGLAANPGFVGEFMKGNYSAPAGFRRNPDGSQSFIPGSEADPSYKRASAEQVAAGTSAGTPDKDYTVGAGQTRYEGGTNKPLFSTAPDKPVNFETERQLRTDYNRELGTFGDVHDGYGRVIAATKQRELNPSKVSPASDIGLVFGFMKMLDPGSVVREGEYATAKNAAGVPDQVRNTYNKIMSGEFLTPEQRQDFLGQAGELYGTARKTASGVAERYRNLARQYGVEPGHSVYLPDEPVAPRVGRDRSGSLPPAMDRSAIEAELRRRGKL